MLTVAIRKRLSPGFVLDVSFTVLPGITNLFGASGSGKTTILRCVAGLLRPDEGRIAVADRALFDSGSGVNVPVQQRRIGYVFQHLALFPHMTIGKNIAYGLHGRPGDEQRARVSEIAESFHIAHLLPRTPGQISGGERQRTALARALVTDPAVLLLDEPLSALDHAIQSRIMDDLRAWNDTRRIPVLYVTHSHREVYGLGEVVIVLEDGRVIASGSPHEVLDHPTRGVLATLAGFENVFDATIVERHEKAGTMHCRLVHGRAELEVPLSEAPIGSRIRIAIRAGDVLVATRTPSGLSARNLLQGTITDLTARGPTIVATVDAGTLITVHLTPGSVETLSLRPGDRVWLIIKTYSCRLLVD